jgi:hypothetical protein
VIAFARDAIVEDLLDLRGRGTTDLALALRAARLQLDRVEPGERVAILLSDCRATAGGDPLPVAAGLDRLHVLGTSADPASVAAGQALAAKGSGRHVTVESLTGLPAAVNALLA